MESKKYTSSRPYAIIVGLDHYLGLQAARILAKKGVPVIGIARSANHYCCKTNVCEDIIIADHLSESIVDVLADLGKKLPQKAVVYPCRDMTVLLISRNRDALTPYFHVALPEAETVEMMLDKLSFYEYALKENLPIADTYILHNREEALEAADKLTYPATIKPPMKTPLWESHTTIKAFKVNDPKEFMEIYDRCCGWSDILIAQIWLLGGDANCYAYNGYYDENSKPLINFTCRSVRKWVPETGNTSLGLECRNDYLRETSIRFFRKNKFKGLAYLEMKKDDRNGKFYIIEPNIGRPTGKAAIAEAGGVALHYTMYCDLTGRPLPNENQQQYIGIKWIYLRQDLQAAFAYWQRGELTLRQWWQSLKGPKKYAVISWSDPMPFLADIKDRTIANLFATLKKPFQKKQKVEATTPLPEPANTAAATPSFPKPVNMAEAAPPLPEPANTVSPTSGSFIDTEPVIANHN